ncbi:hypothetical protein NDA16_003715 [Ustilago loliicola]|nr:hypothetical protein NDA16_003715 [Ustilago loliicola]
MTITTATNNTPAQLPDNDSEWLEKAKDALWQYEIKSETIMQDVFDCIGILENDRDTLFDPPRMAKIAQELNRYIEFMDFVNEVLEDMVMDAEAVKRYRLMKSILTFSALVCAALSTSVAAFPTPSEPLFVSRMVKRQLLPPNPVSTCGDYALEEPQKLEVRSYNDSTTAYLSVASDSAGPSLLTAINPASGSQGAYEFDFQTCNYQGFTQGYSRNSGGSMGAPLEFWGRVVTNVTITDEASERKCLSAQLNKTPETARVTSGTFQLENCNEADSKQWFRLQEGIGGATVSYFPMTNETGFKYNGETPEYFKVDLHPEGDKVNAVEFASENSYQYVRFE